MLTPVFELFQDDKFVTIVIRAPFTKISETEIFIEGTDFKFYSKPYFLRLSLPGKLVEDGRESAKYDAEKGTFTVVVAKETAGQWFEGLDMLTKLLAPKGCTSAKMPTIQILDTGSDGVGEVVEADDDVDWYVDQKPVKDDDLLSAMAPPKYGFGNLRSGVFKTLQAEFCELIDLKNPDSIPVGDRPLLRAKDEDENFDDDYYLADLYENDAIPDILQYEPPWLDAWKRLKRGKRKTDVVQFTEAEREKMKNLPNKEYLIEKHDAQSVYLSLVDIVFAYAYNHRVTEGENNVESGWTICKLSATLSWLEIFSSVKDAVITCFRRSLTYPLFRNWELTNKVMEDTVCIFSLGRRQLLKSLLEVQALLTDTDQRYVLNDLYIADYCVWIQSASEKKLESLAQALEEIKLEKKDVRFSLGELEAAARMAVEEDEIKTLTTTVTNLSIGSVNKEVQKLSSTVSDVLIGSDGKARDSDDDSTDTPSDDDEEEESTGADDEFSESDNKSTELDEENTETDDENSNARGKISESDDKSSELDDTDNKNKHTEGVCLKSDHKIKELDKKYSKTDDKSSNIEEETSESVGKKTNTRR